MSFKKYLIAAISAVSVAGDECYLPIDVMFLQDTTGSFWDDLPKVMNQLRNMTEQILAVHPDSRFGVAEFKDLPYAPFGSVDEETGLSSDYCYALASPVTSNVDQFISGYATLWASGGGDLPESSYQAVINAMKDLQTNWSPMGSAVGDVGARLLILATDAAPHYEGDYTSVDLPDFLVPNDGQVTQGHLDEDCKNKRFPGYDQMAAAVKEVPNTFLAVLAAKESTGDVWAAWEWVVTGLLEESSQFLQELTVDSSNFIDGVLSAIGEVTQTVCSTTTTTLEPTTTPETTTSSSILTFEATTTPEITTTSSIVTSEATTTPETTTTSSSILTFEETTTPEITTSSSIVTSEATTTLETTTILTTEETTTTTATSETTSVTTTTAPTLTTEQSQFTGVVTTSSSTSSGCECTCPPHPNPCACVCGDELVLRIHGRPKHVNADIVYN